MSSQGLREVQRVEVIPLVENIIEMATDPKRDNVKLPRQWAKEEGNRPAYIWGGHGIALLVRVYTSNTTHQILYDTGPSSELLAHNVEVLGIDLKKTEAIVMSHGHWDHFGGLIWALKEIGKETPVYAHRRMFSERRVVYESPEGKVIRDLDPVPTMEEVIAAGGNINWISEPVLLANNTLLRSGEVFRQTDFEKGVPGHQALVSGSWQRDESMIDDGYMVANVKDKGLVLVTGCSHAGIVNILHDARRISGIQTIHAIIGGLHLVGKKNEKKITLTVNGIKEFQPKLLVPSHCTGWRAQHALAQALPEAYVASSVGCLYIIE